MFIKDIGVIISKSLTILLLKILQIFNSILEFAQGFYCFLPKFVVYAFVVIMNGVYYIADMSNPFLQIFLELVYM